MADRTSLQKPDIYTYQDYRQFLKDWLAYKKVSQSTFSLRALAKRAGISVGYINMILSKKRNISEAKLNLLKPHLGLNEQEFLFFKKLVDINDSKTQEEKIENVKKLIRSQNYRSKNQKEVETYKYLNHWYTVVIHELAGRDDFEADLQWIQDKLDGQVTKADIKKSVEFLISQGFLVPQPKAPGKFQRSQKRLICDDEIYRLSLSSFHRQMFHMASESIEKTSREERVILGHTRNLSDANYKKAHDILAKALEDIAELENSDNNNTRVYHFGFLGFPITIKPGDES